MCSLSPEAANVPGPSFHYQTSNSVRGVNGSIVDIITQDMLHLVDPHWQQFEPLSKVWYTIIGIYMCCVGLLAAIGNGLVVYIFIRAPSLRTPSNLLIVNLAFSDFCMIFYMTPCMVYNSIRGTWSLGPFACSLYGVVGSIFGVTSIWTMVIISLDRYNVIVKGIGGKKLTFGSVSAIIVAIWCHGLIWTFAPVFGWNRYVPEGNMTSCGIDYFSKDWKSKSYILIYSVFAYFTPLTTIIWSYFHIVHTVFEHEKSMREQAKKMNVTSLRAEDDGGQRAEIKIAKVSLMVIALWFFSWTPYLIVTYCGIFELLPLGPLSTAIPAICTKTNAIYNPIVYAISHPKFRAAIDEEFPCFKAKATSPSDATSTQTADTAM